MYALAIAPAVFLATLVGGLFALRLRKQLHLILGFSAGAVVGVAFFDLMPEAFSLSAGHHAPQLTASVVGVGFLFYLLLDRFALLHATDALGDEGHHSHVTHRGVLGATSLVTHSMFDGIAIGFAFQVSNAIGILVAAAVFTHDFSDGINTMNIVLKNRGTRWEGLRWLLADATAPVVGIALTFLVKLPASLFGLVLALFCGFFLYLGASDLVPESHARHPKPLTMFTTLLGAAVIYATVSLMG
ncbi:MAG TPA: ZIP family metal transporter [Rhizomicrobium sp.]|nr:ZIP family metal transporter [Rhizomicrobium sp.]